jgi:uridine kinase
MSRTNVISLLADRIAGIRLDHPVRVGIDGVDCAGKTVLADQLVSPLRSLGRKVIRASIDGFHNPRSVRHRRGRNSPEGYFEDSFNHDAILSSLLFPLGPGGSLRYRRSVFDFRTDSPVEPPWETAPPDSILVFEGIFLHRPELLPHWDFSMFVAADFEVTVARAFQRDRDLFRTREKTREVYEQRYVPGQRLYLSEHRPSEKADIVIDNNDFANPFVIGPDGGSA